MDRLLTCRRPHFQDPIISRNIVTDGKLSSGVVTVTIVVEGVTTGDDDDTEDGDPDSEIPEDENGENQDITAEGSAPPQDTDGLELVVLDPETKIQSPVIDVIPIPVEPDSLLVLDSDDGVKNGTGQWLIQPIFRPSTALQMTGASSPRTEGLAMNERTDRFVAAAPLSVAFTESQDGSSSEADVFNSEHLVLGTTTIASTALSLGYAVWLLRGGSLFASLLASLPAWSVFDPLPILDSSATFNKLADDERLQDIVAP